MTSENQSMKDGGTLSRRRRLLGIVPGIAASALLAGAACPAYWLAYAGLLSLPGIGLLLENASLMPATVALCIIALGSFAYQAPSRRGYKPLVLGEWQ